MSFQPVIPLAGIAGWRFLERTQAKQQAAFEKSAELKRDIAYFEEKIGAVDLAPPTSSPTAGCSRWRSAPSASRARSTRRPSSARCSRRAPPTPARSPTG